MPQEKLRVLFLSSWFPTRIIPTLGNFVQRYAEAVALKHHVTALIIQKDPKIETLEIVDEIENEVRIIRVYYPKGNALFQKRNALKKGIEYLQRNGGFQFDIAQLNVVWKEGWQAVYIKKKYKIPFVISEHWTGYHLEQRGPLPWHIKRYMSWVANQAELLLPVTKHLGQAMKKIGFKKPVFIIPNVVHTDVFNLNEAQRNNHTLRFMHVSHLDNDHKNIKGILSVWKHFSEHNSNVHLEIGGDGNLSHLLNWIDDLQINQNSISTFGCLSPQEVAEKMNQSDALVLFSNYENLPLVIIEAMACGLQVIATNVGGIAEHIHGSTPHHLIEPRDENALLSALMKIKKLSWNEKNEIRKYAVANFSAPVISDAFSSAYLKAIKG